MDFAVPIFILAGIGAVFFSGMGVMAASYDSALHSAAERLVRYGPMEFLFPAFLIALVRRWWGVIPLWGCYLLAIAPGLVHLQTLVRDTLGNGTGLAFLGVPALAQCARLVRGNVPEVLDSRSGSKAGSVRE
jgi:hypothetical protein